MGMSDDMKKVLSIIQNENDRLTPVQVAKKAGLDVNETYAILDSLYFNGLIDKSVATVYKKL